MYQSSGSQMYPSRCLWSTSMRTTDLEALLIYATHCRQSTPLGGPSLLPSLFCVFRSGLLQMGCTTLNNLKLASRVQVPQSTSNIESLWDHGTRHHQLTTCLCKRFLEVIVYPMPLEAGLPPASSFLLHAWGSPVTKHASFLYSR